MSQGAGTVAEHNRVIKNAGHVWFGKFGRPLSGQKIGEEIATTSPHPWRITLPGTPTRLLHCADVVGWAPALASTDLDHVPSYYRRRCEDVGTWLKITGFHELDDAVLDKLVVESSRKTVREGQRHWMGSFFWVLGDRDGRPPNY